MAMNMKMITFWDTVLCSLVEVDSHFRGAYCLHHQGALLIAAVHTSDTAVYLNETTQYYPRRSSSSGSNTF
jgi:hypothetical protein